MVPKETYSEWEGQAAVTGILIFHCTESSLWRPAQNTWERKNRLTNMVWAKIIMKWISHGAKRNLFRVRRSSGSNGNTYISLHGKFALASSAKHVRTNRIGWQTWCWPRPLWNGYHMVPKETYSEWEGQAAVTGILIFHCTESSLWRPAQNTWERTE